ncbi:hypothetical protein K438DRAFT_1773197 [Mycena galopus ATCC 62051]|nr:hypothetical protein K438DRAFT_1773197 [Mycena galopus ATCC 62051]
MKASCTGDADNASLRERADSASGFCNTSAQIKRIISVDSGSEYYWGRDEGKSQEEDHAILTRRDGGRSPSFPVPALEKDPCEALAASIALAFYADFEISVHGDLNARTASKKAYPTDPPRSSKDKGRVSMRGTWLCKLLGDYGLAIVNGAICLGPNSGNFTSFQGKNEETMRRTVIDYVACSKSSWDKIVSFRVSPRVPKFDHAATVLKIKLTFDAQNILFASSRKKRKLERTLPDSSDLDKLFIATLESGKDDAKKLRNLFGPVSSVTPSVRVVVHGTCLNAGKISAAAAAAAYWGPDARLNTSARL